MRCLFCGKELAGNKQYCNLSCKNKFKYRNRLVIKNCIVCNKPFTSRAGVKCCSSSCSVKAQKKYNKKCTICGKKFKARGNGKYCSNACYRVANNPKAGLRVSSCIICGENFVHLATAPRETCTEQCSSKVIRFYIDKSLNELFGSNDKDKIRELLKINFQKEVPYNEEQKN